MVNSFRQIFHLFDDGQDVSFFVRGEQAVFGFLYEVFQNDFVLLVVGKSAVCIEEDRNAGVRGRLAKMAERGS